MVIFKSVQKYGISKSIITYYQLCYRKIWLAQVLKKTDLSASKKLQYGDGCIKIS